MTLQKIIKSIAIIICLITLYNIYIESTVLYHFYDSESNFRFIKNHFDFPLILIHLFLLSYIFALLGGFYLYLLKNLGRIFINTMFLVYILILLIAFFPNRYQSLIDFIFNIEDKRISSWYVFGGFSLGKWYEFIIPTIYIATLVFINLRYVSKTLRK